MSIVQTDKIVSALMYGDLKLLSQNEKINYYNHVCESVGLNPLTKPFQFMMLNGREVFYAGKECVEQLRKVHNISVTITNREVVDDMYIVTARAKNPSGREDESIGAVCIGALKGDAKANAIMKAETKSKRRVTLSICGLGMLDESELDTIPSTNLKIAPVSENTNPKELERVMRAMAVEYGNPDEELLRPIFVQLRDQSIANSDIPMFVREEFDRKFKRA